MKNKILLIFLGIVLAVVMLNGLEAVCCEKVSGGAYCMDVVDESLCDQSGDLRTSPTSCEATSYCSVGTCVNNEEGSCIDTTQTICNVNGGSGLSFWDERDKEDVPQCQVGCCLIGDQAAFITQANCNSLSTTYGASNNFLPNIQNEAQCIAMANPDAKGACVVEIESGRTCSMETQETCVVDMGAEFHEGFLCSATELNTNCAPDPDSTTCVEGRDEVFFKDSCGNIANIYDSDKAQDSNYWTEIKEWDESCGFEGSNAGSATCGNCDYYEGSTCGEYERGEDENSPDKGNYLCKDLSCDYEGERLEHGEKMCASSDGFENNLPGSISGVVVCYNGELTVEPCAAYREEICIESSIETIRNGETIDYSTDSCQVNRWETCYEQEEEEDCTDNIERDCSWIELETEANTVVQKILNLRKRVLVNKGLPTIDDEDIESVCFPKYAPGFNFWDNSEDTSLRCALVSDQCEIKYEKKLGGKWKAVKNEECVAGHSWESNLQNLCSAVGDCGVKTNYIGEKGSNLWSELFTGKGYDDEHFDED
jgi:hypothetical protein